MHSIHSIVGGGFDVSSLDVRRFDLSSLDHGGIDHSGIDHSGSIVLPPGQCGNGGLGLGSAITTSTALE
jgi:hypothetical protein